MSEEPGDHGQIGASIEDLLRKRMTQGMGRHLAQPRPPGIRADDQLHGI